MRGLFFWVAMTAKKAPIGALLIGTYSVDIG
jgi:hypothetical protein